MKHEHAITPLKTKDVLTDAQLSRDEIESLLSTAAALKADRSLYAGAFAGLAMVMLFEKPSLRTRMTFEVGFARLGGHAVYLDQQSARIGQRESISDCARNLERWTDVIVARTYSHESIESLAANASIPVINALSDRFHPCQALADMFTVMECFPGRPWPSLSLAYIGDGNNVCHSLLVSSAILGMNMTAITPRGYEPDSTILAEAQSIAEISGSLIKASADLNSVSDHDVIYTDTWVSMGSEEEASTRLEAFTPYQVTPELMALAGPDAVFLHCLPAYRGKEVAASVIDGPRSAVFDQAENRMHAQNALLLHLLGGSKAQDDSTLTRAPSLHAAVR